MLPLYRQEVTRQARGQNRRRLSAEDPSRRDLKSVLATDPARPAGLPALLAPLLLSSQFWPMWSKSRQCLGLLPIGGTTLSG